MDSFKTRGAVGARGFSGTELKFASNFAIEFDSRPFNSIAMNALLVKTADEWRQWLMEHHESATDVWLVFHKRHTGKTSITYDDALDEALCFGWVDSLIKRLDEDKYARKFTPRSPNSKWSDINRKRYAQLKASSRMMPSGLKRPPTERRYAPRPVLSRRMPAYIRAALAKNPAARTHFEKLAPSHRRRYIGWIDLAKQQGTKLRRLREALQLLAAGRKLGLK